MPKRARPTAAALASWRSMLTAYVSLTERLNADLRAEHNLSLDWYDVLLQLVEADGQLTMGDLGAMLLIAPSNCTRRVDRMVAAGLVKRVRDREDTRVVHARVTPKGRTLQRRAAETHLQGIQDHFGRMLNAKQAAEMQAIFDKATASAQSPKN